MASVTVCSDFGAQENKACHCFHFFPPSACHEVMGPDTMILVFWMLNFEPAFSLSYITFIKRLFSSSLLSAIRVVPSTYLRLLIFLPEILIPACASSSLAFHMMYSTYSLKKQGDNIQPWYTPFPILKQSSTRPEDEIESVIPLAPFLWIVIQSQHVKALTLSQRKGLENVNSREAVCFSQCRCNIKRATIQ